jgi:quercetin dioxygenase-like cupin family protein
MEIITLKNNMPIFKDNVSLNSSLLTFDLPTLIEKIKYKPSWTKEGLSTMILLKSPSRQILLTALDKGTEIQSFQSKDSVTIQIIQGKLKFNTRKESVILGKGQMLTLHEKIKYNLSTREETVFLLTILNGSMPPPTN